MRKLGNRKKSGTPVFYRFEKKGLNSYLHICDASGKAMAVPQIERDVLLQLLMDYDATISC